MRWTQKNNHYLENNGWTITRNLVKDKYRYGLYQGSINHGYFDYAKEAKNKHWELTK